MEWYAWMTCCQRMRINLAANGIELTGMVASNPGIPSADILFQLCPGSFVDVHGVKQ